MCWARNMTILLIMECNDKGPMKTAKQGIDTALAERDKAPAPGDAPLAPDPLKPHVSTAPDPAKVFYHSVANSLTFGGDLTLHFAGEQADPIVDRGIVEVEPLLVGGLLANGDERLANSVLRILDATGDVLLKAYIFDPAYYRVLDTPGLRRHDLGLS